MATKLGAPSLVSGDTLSFPLWIDTRNFAAAVAETYTVPAGVNLIRFVATGAGFWVNGNGAAAVPAADITDGTSSAFIPNGSSVNLKVWTGLAISILPDAAAACNLNMWCYSTRHGA